MVGADESAAHASPDSEKEVWHWKGLVGSSLMGERASREPFSLIKVAQQRSKLGVDNIAQGT